MTVLLVKVHVNVHVIKVSLSPPSFLSDVTILGFNYMCNDALKMLIVTCGTVSCQNYLKCYTIKSNQHVLFSKHKVPYFKISQHMDFHTEN